VSVLEARASARDEAEVASGKGSSEDKAEVAHLHRRVYRRSHRRLQTALSAAKKVHGDPIPAGIKRRAMRDPVRFAARPKMREAVDSMAKATTPEPFSTSTTSNWVARAGGLPPYIQHVAHDLMDGGKSESHAIEMAVGIVKNWSHGHDGHGKPVHPDTVAAAKLAITEWEAKKASAHVKEARDSSASDSHHNVKCPSCGTVQSATHKTCSNCGHSLAAARRGKFANLNEGFRKGGPPLAPGKKFNKKGEVVDDKNAARVAQRTAQQRSGTGPYARGTSSGSGSSSSSGGSSGSSSSSTPSTRSSGSSGSSSGSGSSRSSGGSSGSSGSSSSQRIPITGIGGGAQGGDFNSKHPRGAAGSGRGGKFIAKGDSGGAVKKLQGRLGVKADGQFGKKTARAVRRFQRRNGLRPDGVVGPKTNAALRHAPVQEAFDEKLHPRGPGGEWVPKVGDVVYHALRPSEQVHFKSGPDAMDETAAEVRATVSKTHGGESTIQLHNTADKRFPTGERRVLNSTLKPAPGAPVTGRGTADTETHRIGGKHYEVTPSGDGSYRVSNKQDTATRTRVISATSHRQAAQKAAAQEQPGSVMGRNPDESAPRRAGAGATSRVGGSKVTGDGERVKGQARRRANRSADPRVDAARAGVVNPGKRRRRKRPTSAYSATKGGGMYD
jgi:peptidoglycan hydrolase-like protein with peptidoglycan-binding domain